MPARRRRGKPALTAVLLLLALDSCSSRTSPPAATEAEPGTTPGPVEVEAEQPEAEQPGAEQLEAEQLEAEPEAEPAPGAAAAPGAGPAARPGAPSRPGPSPAAAPAIVDRPIRFDDERKALTIEYRQLHQDPAIDSVEIEPGMIVLHYTGGSSADGTWRYFDRLTMEGGRQTLKKAGAVNVSSHFLVDRDGTIYRLMPETWMARHCIGLNHIAIGVENVGDGDAHPLTRAQVDANVALIRYLAGKHSITHLIGHHESRRFDGGPLFVERDPGYRNRKSDPGPAFMAAVRAGVADLGLAGPPEAEAKGEAKSP